MLRKKFRTLAAGLFLLAAGQPTLAQQVVPQPHVPIGPPPGEVLLPPAGAIPPAPACSPAARPTPRQRYRQGLEDKALGHRGEFFAQPLGMAIDQHIQVQVTNGVASRMILHDYDFICGTAKLNHRGKERLLMILPWLQHNPFPVVIENMPHTPALAEGRRLEVLRELLTLSPGLDQQRVVVGVPLSRQRIGEEALLVHQIMLLQTRTAGAMPGTGAGPFGGTPGIGGGGGGGFAPSSGFAPSGGFAPGTGGGGR